MFKCPYHLILASASPRRREILSLMGFEFEVRVKEIEEIVPEDLPIKSVPEFLAQTKAKAYQSELTKSDLLITADTVVIQKNKIIGKPSSREDAIEILTGLCGDSHLVITGVCLSSTEKQISFSCKSKVYLCELSQQEIEYYIDKFKPFDKAGSYGVQDWIGAVAIRKIKGSYYNVMGLPSDLLYQELKSLAFTSSL